MTLITKSNPIFRNLFETKTWNPSSLGLMEDFFNSREQHFTPAVNIHETEKMFLLDFKVPGFEKENFKITLENEILSVSAEFKKEENTVEKNFSRREFVMSSFKRTFTIPEMVNPEAMEAKYENGILTIVLPKKEQAIKQAPKEIKIS